MGERLQRVFEFDEFRLDATDRLLFRGSELVPLSPKVLDTLVMLVENSGRVLHKDELMERVWEGTFVEENNLSQAISALRKALGGRSGDHHFIETVPKRGYRFVAPVSEAAAGVARAPVAAPPASAPDGDPLAWLEPVGGAVPLDSGFYIVRPADDEFQAAILRGDSIVLLKGARQMGKTSLLARGLQNAREAGARVVLTDFQDLGAADLESAETLFMTLGKAMAEELDLDTTPRSTWDAEDSANTNFARYMRREVLKGPSRVVWGLDEADRLFGFDFANEVFGLFRAWHNKRALDPTGPWQRLTLAMAYATEAHLFITDANQSPFNVGTRLALEDFTPAQVAELNRRYASPLGAAQLDRFYGLVGGHPFLVQQGLRAIAHGLSFDAFHAHAHREEGPFGGHLRHLSILLARDPALGDAMRLVLDGRPCPGEELFHRLRSAGIIAGESAREARPRCPLYALYLVQHLL